MPNRYQRGDFVPWAWQPLSVAQFPSGVATPSAPNTTWQIKGHTIDLTALCIDVTNTGVGGFRARLGGLGDADGTVTLSLDKDLLPWLAGFNITPGTPGNCIFGLSPSQGVMVPVIIPKVHYESQTEKEVQWSVQVQGNSLAGVLTYPPVLT